MHGVKLDIQPLRERALADIKSKVARDNVVGEVFSWITAKYVLHPLFQPWDQPQGAHAFAQSKGAVGDGMRYPGCKLQRPKNAFARETKHPAYLRRKLPPLWRRIKAWV